MAHDDENIKFIKCINFHQTVKKLTLNKGDFG
jgi:hypothetical protein